MNTHGRITRTTLIAAFLLTSLATGCQSLPGSPHPFTTLFEKQELVYRPAINVHDTSPIRFASADSAQDTPTHL